MSGVGGVDHPSIAPTAALVDELERLMLEVELPPFDQHVVRCYLLSPAMTTARASAASIAAAPPPDQQSLPCSSPPSAPPESSGVTFHALGESRHANYYGAPTSGRASAPTPSRRRLSSMGAEVGLGVAVRAAQPPTGEGGTGGSHKSRRAFLSATQAPSSPSSPSPRPSPLEDGGCGPSGAATRPRCDGKDGAIDGRLLALREVLVQYRAALRPLMAAVDARERVWAALQWWSRRCGAHETAGAVDIVAASGIPPLIFPSGSARGLPVGLSGATSSRYTAHPPSPRVNSHSTGVVASPTVNHRKDGGSRCGGNGHHSRGPTDPHVRLVQRTSPYWSGELELRARVGRAATPAMETHVGVARPSRVRSAELGVGGRSRRAGTPTVVRRSLTSLSEHAPCVSAVPLAPRTACARYFLFHLQRTSLVLVRELRRWRRHLSRPFPLVVGGVNYTLELLLQSLRLATDPVMRRALGRLDAPTLATPTPAPTTPTRRTSAMRAAMHGGGWLETPPRPCRDPLAGGPPRALALDGSPASQRSYEEDSRVERQRTRALAQSAGAWPEAFAAYPLASAVVPPLTEYDGVRPPFLLEADLALSCAGEAVDGGGGGDMEVDLLPHPPCTVRPAVDGDGGELADVGLPARRRRGRLSKGASGDCEKFHRPAAAAAAAEAWLGREVDRQLACCRACMAAAATAATTGGGFPAVLLLSRVAALLSSDLASLSVEKMASQDAEGAHLWAAWIADVDSLYRHLEEASSSMEL